MSNLYPNNLKPKTEVIYIESIKNDGENFIKIGIRYAT